MDDWLDLYRRVARANGGEPDAGRRLKSWALRGRAHRHHGHLRHLDLRHAGRARLVERTVGGPDDWPRRTPNGRRRAVTRRSSDSGRSTAAWREWGRQEDGWFTVLHGEILCRKNSLP